MNKTSSAKADRISSVMAASGLDSAVQLAQTRYRLDLADSWRIQPGASVLEIGCGQGDMTAVLADAVGASGRVLAVDVADPSYGAPVTLGASAQRLKETPLGPRTEFRFGFDVLDETVAFPENTFDEVVLAHCSWYFTSLDQVERTLARVRPWARRLCFAEWDMRPQTEDQLPHLLAVLIQGQIEASGARGEGNVRTPFSREALLRGLGATGWTVRGRRSMDTGGLQDGDWEIGMCRRLLDSAGWTSLVPEAVRDLVLSEADVLRALARQRGNPALPAYSLTAR